MVQEKKTDTIRKILLIYGIFTITLIVVFSIIFVLMFNGFIGQPVKNATIETTPSNDDVYIYVSFFKDGQHGELTGYLTLRIANPSGHVIYAKKDVHIEKVMSWNERVRWTDMSPEPVGSEQLTAHVSWGLVRSGVYINSVSDTFFRP